MASNDILIGEIIFITHSLLLQSHTQPMWPHAD
jgi:hypothetical protein